MKQQVQLMGLHKEFQAVFYLKQCLLLQLCLGLNPFFLTQSLPFCLASMLLTLYLKMIRQI